MGRLGRHDDTDGKGVRVVPDALVGRLYVDEGLRHYCAEKEAAHDKASHEKAMVRGA